MALLFEALHSRLLEFENAFKPVHVPLKVASLFDLSTEVLQEPRTDYSIISYF